MDKTKRRRNFSEVETAILKEILTKNIRAIECKKTDSASLKAKKRAWQSIADEYNAQTNFPRSWENLKKKWENLKLSFKDQIVKAKDSKGPKVEGSDEDIVNLLKLKMNGMSPIHESDSPSDNDDVFIQFKEEIMAEPDLLPESPTSTQDNAQADADWSDHSATPNLTRKTRNRAVDKSHKTPSPLLAKKSRKTELEIDKIKMEKKYYSILCDNAMVDSQLLNEKLKQEKLRTELLVIEIEEKKRKLL